MHPSFGDMLDFGDIESVEMVEKSDPKYMKSKSKRLNWVPYGNASWFLDVTSYHISRLCDARNIGPQESSHLTTEWTAFYKYMAQSLESINYALSDPDLTPGDQAIVLMQIANVTSAGVKSLPLSPHQTLPGANSLSVTSYRYTLASSSGRLFHAYPAAWRGHRVAP